MLRSSCVPCFQRYRIPRVSKPRWCKADRADHRRIYEKNFLRGIVHLKIVTGFAGYVVTVVGQEDHKVFLCFDSAGDPLIKFIQFIIILAATSSYSNSCSSCCSWIRGH